MENLKDNLIYLLVGTLIAIFIGGIQVSSSNRDKDLMNWAELYEVCVMREYKTTPTEYYNENGEYPEFDVKVNSVNQND